MEVMRAFQNNTKWEEDDVSSDERRRRSESYQQTKNKVDIEVAPVRNVDAAPREKISVKEIDPTKYGLKSFDALFDELDDKEPVGSPSVSHAREMMKKGEELRAKSSLVSPICSFVSPVVDRRHRNAMFDWKKQNSLKMFPWMTWRRS